MYRTKGGSGKRGPKKKGIVMGNKKGSYGYEVSTGSNGGVVVGEGNYCMEVTTPTGKTFSREGYDTVLGAESGAIQTIDNMQAPGAASIGAVSDMLELLSFGRSIRTGFPGILCDDGRSA